MWTSCAKGKPAVRATCVIALMAGALVGAPAQEWDQVKAREKVRQVLEIESAGQPWDRIPWLTDPKAAAAEAKRRDRPIFVFFYLAKQPGQAAAPC